MPIRETANAVSRDCRAHIAPAGPWKPLENTFDGAKFSPEDVQPSPRLTGQAALRERRKQDVLAEPHPVMGENVDLDGTGSSMKTLEQKVVAPSKFPFLCLWGMSENRGHHFRENGLGAQAGVPAEKTVGWSVHSPAYAATTEARLVGYEPP
ncbi:MAG: hypothetical protein ACRD1X_17630 [Vicinamibacteria bacterium]